MTFELALQRVEPGTDADTARDAHAQVRAVLSADSILSRWGIDPILIGSYKRNVAIRRVKDVDVFCRLPDLPAHVTGQEALKEFHRVLAPRYDLEAQARSYKVMNPAWGDLHVDVVPARPCGDYWQIPDRESHGRSWQETNPDRLTTVTSQMNSRFDGKYVPLVKLLRQTRRALSIDRPGGLYMEMALLHAIDLDLVTPATSWADLYISALRGVAEVTCQLVDESCDLPDPTRPGEHLTFRAEPAQWQDAKRLLDQAATDAEATRDASRCQEAATFHRLLGTTSDGAPVYPLPDDCRADGSTRSPITPGTSTVGSSQRFA